MSRWIGQPHGFRASGMAQIGARSDVAALDVIAQRLVDRAVEQENVARVERLQRAEVKLCMAQPDTDLDGLTAEALLRTRERLQPPRRSWRLPGESCEERAGQRSVGD